MSGARARILASALLLLGLSTAVSVLALRQILLVRADDRIDRSLAHEVDEFRRILTSGRDPRTNTPLRNDVRRAFDIYLGSNVPDTGEAAYTFLADRPYRTNAGDPATLRPVAQSVAALGAVDTARGDDLATSAGRVRYLAVPVLAGARHVGTFVTTANVDEERAEIRDVVQTAAVVSGGVFLLGALAAFLAAGRVLAPLRGLTDAARAITETDLSRRIEVEGNDEIAQLGRTFNAMLDRLEAAFASQRALISDAGHELRTPITIVRGHLELLGDDPQERRETIALVTDELDRMGRFVDDLLTLARAERADFLRPGDVDLDELTDELLAKAQALAPRDWRLGGRGVGRVTADRQRLTQAVMNLSANAVQHTRDGDRIELGSALRDGRARLWVRDSGPGIGIADRERIFDRFARGNGAARRRAEGAGLGLAIVRAIAEAHGGRVDLESAPGAGATFTIEIPADDGAAPVT